MNIETPWATCFLTRMLILYLEKIGKETDIDYQEILKENDAFNHLDNPKIFLKDYNNWVPYHVLRNLTGAAERAAGTKEVAYLAARHYFQGNYGPSLLEIIAKLPDNMEEVLSFSNLWAAGYANYLKLQCLVSSDPNESSVTLLSQYGLNVEPSIGSIYLIRGNYEGFTQLFDCITDAACSEEISQVKIETVAKEFGSYRIEQRNDQLSILENDSKREVVAARKVFLKSETIPLSENKPRRADGQVVSPKNKSLTVLTPGIEENPTHWKRENAAYQIVHEGTLQAGPLRFPFQKGQIFNAPYSRYRFKWSSNETRLLPPETAQARSEIIPLLFNHLTELRETHRQLLRCAIENKALAQANKNLKGALQKESDFFGIIGKSAKMKKLIEQVELISQVDSTILITGETGTGKELLAKAIHQSSPRRDQKFVAINCAALSESLLESELFGYEKGAFTGAISQKKGIFEAAHGGTLFLDEVGEISLTMQAKLLRVLEQQEIQRVGGRETIAIDVRILSATNRDLREMVASGKFRSDLYYRLHVISLAVPPLRERFEDLLSLVDYYLNFFSQKSSTCSHARPCRI